MLTLPAHLESESQLDLAKTVYIKIDGNKHAIEFRLPKLKAILELFLAFPGVTIPHCNVYTDAGLPLNLSALTDDIAIINKAIEQFNLRIVNHKGVGYRLVEGADTKQIKSFRSRTFYTRENHEITITCNEDSFSLLGFIDTPGGVSGQEIKEAFRLPTILHAQRFVQLLATKLREIGWNILSRKHSDGLWRYELVDLRDEK